MALCFWFSGLEQYPGKPVGWQWPRALALLRVSAPGAPSVFAVTVSGAAAFGVASLTSQQILDLNADAAVWARELPAGWRALTVADLPAAALNKLNTALANRGLNPGIVGTDTLPQAFQKILNAMPGASNPDFSDWSSRFFDPALLGEPF